MRIIYSEKLVGILKNRIRSAFEHSDSYVRISDSPEIDCERFLKVGLVLSKHMDGFENFVVYARINTETGPIVFFLTGGNEEECLETAESWPTD